MFFSAEADIFYILLCFGRIVSRECGENVAVVGSKDDL
jgi:hypothetical protein